MTPRLLVVTSHPIQYQAPWFRALHRDPRVDLTVLFLALPDARDQGVGFGKEFEWDVPLLEGYRWCKAESATGGISDGYFGIKVGRAAAEILELEPDVILVTGWQNYGMLQSLRAAVHSGRPVLVRAESNGLKPVSWAQRVKARLGLRGVTRALPIGRANEKFYRSIGLSSLLGPVVPYFVDNDFFAAGAERTQRSKIREKYGIPGESTCFLFAGKLVEKKRPMDALNALKSVTERNGAAAAHLLIIGSGALQSELQQYVDEHALPVTFAGFLNQSEMPAAYAAADCLLLPSDYGETWGLVVNEAMACGVPAIVSDHAGCGPDLIEDGETGMLHAFGVVDSLVEKMNGFLSTNAAEQQRMGQNARARVSSGYSVALAVDRTVEAVLGASSG